MKRFVTFFLWGLGMSWGWTYAQQPPSSPTTQPKAETPAPSYPLESWKPLASKEANLSINFPVVPKDQTTRYRMQTGLAEEHRYTVPTRDGTYQMAYTFLSDNVATPETIRARFSTLLKGLRENPKIKWIGGGDTAYEGNPGIEFKLQSLDGKIITWSRQYFAYGCVYEITARYVPQEPELKEPRLFMDSFKLWGPPLIRPTNLTLAAETLADFTPLSQTTFHVTPEKLLAHAIEKPEPKFEFRKGFSPRSFTMLLTISEDGKVLEVEALDGFSVVENDVSKTMKKWTFKPFLLDGKPVKVQGRLTLTPKAEAQK